MVTFKGFEVSVIRFTVFLTNGEITVYTKFKLLTEGFNTKSNLIRMKAVNVLQSIGVYPVNPVSIQGS